MHNNLLHIGWLVCLLCPSVQADDATITVPLNSTINQTYTCNLEGQVVKVSDGDTITVLDSSKTQHKIRLAGIDAPEKKQDFGNAAKKILAGKVAGQTVCVSWHKKDKYGRLVGNVLVGNQLANLQMIQEGFAWHYKKYAGEQTADEQTVFAQAETSARLAVIGLWSQPYPVAPWDWRDGQKQSPAKQARQQPATTDKLQANSSFTCGEKRFCTHMDSCAEATFYLTQCRLSRLDKDGDGIPCESLCGLR